MRGVIRQNFYPADSKLAARSNDRILWIDCLGGLVVGCVVVGLCRPLSDLENLPVSAVVFMGLTNLTYGGYSLYVTTRNPRPMILVQVLAIANMCWLACCLVIVNIYWSQISTLGWLHVIGEGVYVASLGYLEWRWRYRLSAPSSNAVG